jgi:hypothetical protein
VPNPNEVDLTIIVNGQPIPIEANIHQPLHAVIEQVLNKSGNSGQPIDNWELRDAGGQILDPARTVGEYHFTSGVNLFLNLKAGVGG